MAPELRQRKPAKEPKATNGVAKKVVEKTTTKGKRKAAEDSSPVTLKKQKATKTEVQPEKTPSKSKSKPAAKKIEVTEEETIIPVTDDTSDSENEDDDKAQELATQVDAEDEPANANGESLFEPGQDVGKIPKEGRKQGKRESTEPGVVYIGRIPHGFYEHEMRSYFSQFGTITKLRLSRNKKTGASKHFAFVEFADEGTAEVVAKTMDNYLLFGHILKCKTIPKEQVHDELFKGANRRFKKVPWNKMAGKDLEKPQSESAWEKRVAREQSKRSKNASKLEAMGYSFDAPDLKEIPEPPAPVAIEAGDAAVKAIEAPPAEDEAGQETEVVEEVIVKKGAGKEPKVEARAISATKPKASTAKGAKSGGKTRKSKA